MRKQRGITLVALVITIIVLLILAGVTVNLILGERGIFSTAMSSVEESKISEYKEKIELSRVEVSSENLGVVTLDNLISKIYEQKIVAEESIEKIDETKAKMITPEGYVFVITADKIEYVGKLDEIPRVPEVDLDKGNVEISIDPETWTNKNVKVTIINHEEEDYTIQYSLDKGLTYTNYTEPLTIEQITTIYVRLMNSLGDKGEFATYEISKIDKLPPINFVPTYEVTTNSITIKASEASDAETNEKYGESGIKEIWYSNDDGLTWKTNEDKTNTKYTYTNLTQNTLYKIRVKVVDNAENETIMSTQEITTKQLTYTIEYNGNGNTGGSTQSSIHEYGVEKELTINGYTKTGCEFKGWATSSNGEIAYTDGQKVSNLSSTNGETITLYAVWESTEVYLYNYGTINTELVGGISQHFHDSYFRGGTFGFATDHYYSGDNSTSSYNSCCAKFNNPIDFTNYSTLRISCQKTDVRYASSSYAGGSAVLISEYSDYDIPSSHNTSVLNETIFTNTVGNSSGMETFEIDISEIKGSYYLYTYAWSGDFSGSTAILRVYQIVLLP